jgi:hypothetical protein
VVSGLHASVTLILAGHVQEAGVLFRTIDDFLSQIHFLGEPELTGDRSEAHNRFVQQFFDEDIRTPDEMMRDSQKVERVTRAQMGASTARRKAKASEARVYGVFDKPRCHTAPPGRC